MGVIDYSIRRRVAALEARTRHWATLAFSVAGGAPLAVNHNAYVFGVGDIAITSQSGTDFSVGTVDGHTVVKTAAGGRFQFGIYWGGWGAINLDASFPNLRSITFAAGVGSLDAAHNPFSDARFGVALPLDPNLTVIGGLGEAAMSYASVPGFSEPGDPALYDPLVEGLSLRGTDSIATTGLEDLPAAIWEV